MVGAASAEPYLATNGFLDFYETLIGPAKVREIQVPKTDATYAVEVTKRISGSKPAAAHAVVEEMKRRGAASVPKALRLAILKAAALGGRC
jgi:putative ATP-dependent endonuclease of OLD family